MEKMKSADELSTFARKVGKRLEKQHGIKVPHSALRDSLASALGQEAHALKRVKAGADEESLRQEIVRLEALVKKAPVFFHPGYDFDGQKMAWLIEAGLVEPAEEQGSPAQRELSLWQAVPTPGEVAEFSLDPFGRYPIPLTWHPQEAQLLHFELDQSSARKDPGLLEDLGERALQRRFLKDGDFDVRQVKTKKPPRAVLKLSAEDWDSLLEDLMLDDIFNREFTAWRKAQTAVQTRDVDQASSVALMAFCDELEKGQVCLPALTVLSEWVYPDEDSDSSMSMLDLETGAVHFQFTVPSDAHHSDVRKRVWIPEYLAEVPEVGVGHQLSAEAFTDKGGKTCWFVQPDALKQIRAQLKKLNDLS